ncbi:MAG: DUF3846 domain-containing protein [Oscillospiraceae bacterium]
MCGEIDAGRMQILLVEPEKRPAETEIDRSLEAMQRIVGGPIQAVYPFEEPVALICNDDGKCLGLPLNRALYLPEGRQPYDVVAGTFFLCGAPPDSEDFVSLTDEQVRRYRRLFAEPERFLQINGRLLVIKTERST